MGKPARFLVRAWGMALALLVAACTVGSVPIGRQMEKRLLKNKLSDAEFGARISPHGERIQFTMFTGHVLPDPVEVPMTTRFRGLPGVEARLNDRKSIR